MNKPNVKSFSIENSIPATSGGQSEKVAISAVTASSAAITTESVTIYSTVDCFIRVGATPQTAVSDGTDDFIPAGNKLRLHSIKASHVIAFITSGATGTVYITPGG